MTPSPMAAAESSMADLRDAFRSLFKSQPLDLEEIIDPQGLVDALCWPITPIQGSQTCIIQDEVEIGKHIGFSGRVE